MVLLLWLRDFASLTMGSVSAFTGFPLFIQRESFYELP